MRLVIIILLAVALFFGWQKLDEYQCNKKKEMGWALLENISNNKGYYPGKTGLYKGREITVGSFFRSPITANVFYINIKINSEAKNSNKESSNLPANTYLHQETDDDWRIWYNDSYIREWNNDTFIKIYDELVKAAEIVEKKE